MFKRYNYLHLLPLLMASSHKRQIGSSPVPNVCCPLVGTPSGVCVCIVAKGLTLSMIKHFRAPITLALTPRTGDISPKRVGVVTGGLFQRQAVIFHANITLQVLRDSGSEVVSNDGTSHLRVRDQTLRVPLFDSPVLFGNEGDLAENKTAN